LCLIEPKGGCHHAHATPNRKAPEFVKALNQIAQAHSPAKPIHRLTDILNTHCAESLIKRCGDREGAQAVDAVHRALHA
jgi:hypothetical protein